MRSILFMAHTLAIVLMFAVALMVSTTPAQASDGEIEHMLNTAQEACDQDCRKRQVARYVKEIQEHFTIKGEPIHPFVFRDFEGYMSDSRPIITSIDVLAGVNSNYFLGMLRKAPMATWRGGAMANLTTATRSSAVWRTVCWSCRQTPVAEAPAYFGRCIF